MVIRCMSVIELIGVLVLIVNLVSLGVHVYQIKTAAESLQVEDAEIVDMSLKGFKTIILTVRLYVNNPSSYDIEVAKIYYDVYMDGEFLEAVLERTHTCMLIQKRS